MKKLTLVVLLGLSGLALYFLLDIALQFINSYLQRRVEMLKGLLADLEAINARHAE